MAITRATNIAGLGTVFDALTDSGGLEITSGVSTITDLNTTRLTGTAVTFTNATITGDLTVQGTTTTLDTTVENVDLLEVGANSAGAAVTITQAGAGDFVNVGTAGSAFTINNRGKIGIGTIAPEYLLHLESDSPVIAAKATNQSSGLRLNILNQTSGKLFRVQDFGTTVFTIDADGQAGIGTDIPDSIFHIEGTQPRLTLSDTGTNAHHRINGDSSVGNLAFDVDYDSATSAPSYVVNIKGEEKVRVTGIGGSIGIGTHSPFHIVDIRNGSDAQNIVVVRGADETEYFGLGVSGGNAVLTAGGAGPTDCGLSIRTSDGGTETQRIVVTSTGQVKLTANQSTIITDTSDGSDNKTMFLGGGGGASASRGAYVWAKGNEHADTGELVLSAGNVTGGDMSFYVGGSRKFYIADDGKVMVNGTVSDHEFKVVGDSVFHTNNDSGVSARFRRNSATGRAQFTVEESDGTPMWRVGCTGAGGTHFNFYDQVDSSHAITIEKQGLGKFTVGIQTNDADNSKVVDIHGGDVRVYDGTLSVSNGSETVTITPNVTGYPTIINGSTPDTLQLASFGGVDICFDSNNNSTGQSFNVRSNGQDGGGDLLFTINETGHARLGGGGMPNAQSGVGAPEGGLKLGGDLNFDNNAILASDGSNSSSNLDHIWHSDTAPGGSYGGGGTWHFVSDGAYKASGAGIDGGSKIECNSLQVRGYVAKGSGSFRIRHPLAGMTTTHTLCHSFIEGPRADLIYRGEVRLVSGIATIIMDEAVGLTTGTWDLLCRDPDVFVTNNEDWTPVKAGITSTGVLTIQAQDPTCTAKVNWLVIAERHDDHMFEALWTDENGRPILEYYEPEEPEVGIGTT